MTHIRKEMEIGNADLFQELFGNLDEHVKYIEKVLNVDISMIENKLVIDGDAANVQVAQDVFLNLKKMLSGNHQLDRQSINYAIDLALSGNSELLSEMLNDVVCITSSGKPVKPKTLGQKRYLDAIRRNEIIFGIGPAGTGKTFLAIAMAVKKLKNKEVSRIVLTRPAVEAGESLGFLPGDLQEKVDPYLRPIYDALFDILGYESFTRMLEKGIIEVAPLAYMRGRTLDASFVILDEAQNTTKEQMKMFLTRLGFGSKAIITGDITQIDIQRKKDSGLVSIQEILKNIDGIDFTYLNKYDVVRHPLIQKIIDAYEKFDERLEKRGG